MFLFIPSWGRFPCWLIFFRWVETTNHRNSSCLWLGILHRWRTSSTRTRRQMKLHRLRWVTYMTPAIENCWKSLAVCVWSFSASVDACVFYLQYPAISYSVLWLLLFLSLKGDAYDMVIRSDWFYYNSSEEFPTPVWNIPVRPGPVCEWVLRKTSWQCCLSKWPSNHNPSYAKKEHSAYSSASEFSSFHRRIPLRW